MTTGYEYPATPPPHPARGSTIRTAMDRAETPSYRDPYAELEAAASRAAALESEVAKWRRRYAKAMALVAEMES